MSAFGDGLLKITHMVFVINKLIYELGRDEEFHFTDDVWKHDLGLI